MKNAWRKRKHIYTDYDRVLIAVFYLFMIRPENKRKKQQDEMRSSLRKGDQITTIGGVVAAS